MIERVVRNDEVVGLIPIWSTNLAAPSCLARRGIIQPLGVSGIFATLAS